MIFHELNANVVFTNDTHTHTRQHAVEQVHRSSDGGGAVRGAALVRGRARAGVHNLAAFYAP